MLSLLYCCLPAIDLPFRPRLYPHCECLKLCAQMALQQSLSRWFLGALFPSAKNFVHYLERDQCIQSVNTDWSTYSCWQWLSRCFLTGKSNAVWCAKSASMSWCWTSKFGRYYYISIIGDVNRPCRYLSFVCALCLFTSGGIAGKLNEGGAGSLPRSIATMRELIWILLGL